MRSIPTRTCPWLSMLLVALLAPAPATADSVHEAQLAAYVEIWNSGDTEALDEVVTEDFTRHGNYGSADSREELATLIRGFHRFYRDLRYQLLDSFAGAEKGAIRLRFRGGYRNAGFEMDATNFSMVRFSDGKIAEEWVAGNTTDFWTSMGYRIMPPGTRMVPPPVLDPPGTHVPPRPELPTGKLAALAEQAMHDPPKKAGQIGIIAEVDCRLWLDGEPIGAIEAGSSVLLPVARGEYFVEARSRGGALLFSESVKVRRDRIERIDIAGAARAIVHREDGIAEDLQTGLMWHTEDNGDDINRGAAAAYCAESSKGGYSDWRLPSIYELETLYAPEARSSKRFKTIEGIHLSGCCPWTLSPHGDFHWTFIFYNGLRYIKHASIKKTSRALCTRHAG